MCWEKAARECGLFLFIAAPALHSSYIKFFSNFAFYNTKT
jgi:hypothetical protein